MEGWRQSHLLHPQIQSFCPMRREFLLNVSFLVAVNLVIKPLYIFGIDMQVQNTVGQGAFGLFAALFSLTYILQIINDPGLQQYNNKVIASDRALLQERYPILSGLKVWLAGFYLLVCLLTAFVVGYEPAVWTLLIHIAINHILLSWLLFLRSNISGLGLYRRDSLLSISDKVWMLLICGILLYTPGLKAAFTIETFVWAQTVSLVLSILLGRYFLIGKSLRWDGLPSFARVRPLVRESLPYALLVLLMTSYNRMDTFLIERLLPDGAVRAGEYYMAFRLLDALNNFAFLFGALLLPMLANMLSRKEAIHPLIEMITRLLVAGSMAAAISMTRYAHEWIFWLYDDPTADAVQSLQLLSWVFVPVCMMYIFSTLLTAGNHLRQMNTLLAGIVVLNILLLIALIPGMGIPGAALAALISQVFVAGGMIVLAFRSMPLQWSGSLFLRISLFSVTSILFLFLPMPEVLPWQFNFAGLFVMILLLAVLFGLLPAGRFLSILKARVAR